jgi:hypothetical protein
MESANAYAPFVTLQFVLNRSKLIITAQEMTRHNNRNIGHHGRLPRKGDGASFRFREVVAQSLASYFIGNSVDFAALVMVRERRYPTRLHSYEQSEARSLACRLPQRRITFECGERGFGSIQILVRNHTKHVVCSIVAFLHPTVDVLASPELPVVKTWHMPEPLKLNADPMRPLTICLGIADEDVGHVARSACV